MLFHIGFLCLLEFELASESEKLRMKCGLRDFLNVL